MQVSKSKQPQFDTGRELDWKNAPERTCRFGAFRAFAWESELMEREFKYGEIAEVERSLLNFQRSAEVS